MGKVTVVGSSNTDLTVQCPSLPGRGETVLGGELYKTPGGKGANQAVAAARAGADVTFVGAVGDDDFGRAAVEGLRADGIRTDHVATKPGTASGVALILVEQAGENIIAVAPGANAELSPDDVRAASDAIRSADVLLLQFEVPIESVVHAARIAHAAGAHVVLNPAPMPDRPLTNELLACVDYIVPNEGELARLAGAYTEAVLFEAGVSALVVTMGAEGVRIVTPDATTRVPGVEVEAVDAVGAGDCFCGYLAAGLSEGMELPDAARFACSAAALSVTRRGAQTSIPRRDEVARSRPG